MKVVNELARAGYVESVRGRSSGIRLGRSPEEINIGAVIRHTEDGFDLLDCDNCIVAPACGLTGILRQALGAFLCVLDAYTLADLLTKRSDLARLFASRSEEHTSELQSLMRISYAVFCLKKKTTTTNRTATIQHT